MINGTAVVPDRSDSKKEEVGVNPAGETLTIKGEKKEDKEVKEDDYYRPCDPTGHSCGALLCPAK